MLTDLYRLVMDPKRNPLSRLTRMVTFQYMCILAYMWSAIFGIAVGSTLVFGISVVGHAAILLGIFVTFDVFRRAQKRALHARDLYRDPERPGVRYDDIWGG